MADSRAQSAAEYRPPHPRVAVVVDTCDLASGRILQVTTRGEAEVVPFDRARAERWRRRYVGADAGLRDRFGARVGVLESPTR